jgi:hypothetical protein
MTFVYQLAWDDQSRAIGGFSWTTRQPNADTSSPIDADSHANRANRTTAVAPQPSTTDEQLSLREQKGNTLREHWQYSDMKGIAKNNRSVHGVGIVAHSCA